MKKVLTSIRRNAMLIHTYIHTYIQGGWNSYLTITSTSLLGGHYGN